jgi:hypothetical protein
VGIAAWESWQQVLVWGEEHADKKQIGSTVSKVEILMAQKTTDCAAAGKLESGAAKVCPRMTR